MQSGRDVICDRYYYSTLAYQGSVVDYTWVKQMNLTKAEVGREYIIKAIETDDEELNSFLFSLGCYSGEPITVVSRRRRNCVVSIKDGRYTIDDDLAAAIII